MINDTNQTTYQANDIVSYYAQLSQLQPAEATILNLLKGQLSSMTMLDIGVGGGRTTKYFARLVKQYIGIDYSAEMIAACQQKFSNDSSILLEVGDARDLSRFNDNYFDFILFSFNGIDYMSHADRLQVFQEISRVGKPGGYFFFSTHNLQGIEREFNWQNHLNINPILTYVNLVMFAFLRFFNRPLTYQQLHNYPYAIIRDESHNFRLKTYYIRPIEQIKQLQGIFNDIKVYSWKTGQEITNKQHLCSNIDMWLYYLCLIK
ncbi:class I SAM-dependent methyltransferase [Crocosphaera sp. XPORK-15E]|uniref:class I SAM-dependent methyltransferase n=1 Tax=Crocosphaera sp. XPORK-15E TaxID=3110247 RepID=UPI002B1EE619|nr:methyltransferase domain-containing protein [Crocosphaera sp. XPORK-15E]MEA5533683.1 methyltransferase domain-containing protein [Crocosphaera sp. XPORK-15E]